MLRIQHRILEVLSWDLYYKLSCGTTWHTQSVLSSVYWPKLSLFVTENVGSIRCVTLSVHRNVKTFPLYKRISDTSEFYFITWMHKLGIYRSTTQTLSFISQNQTLIQFLSVFPTLPFQISHSVLEWSNSSIHRPLPSGEARNSLRSESYNWYHISSCSWMYIALQYDWWVHRIVAYSKN